MGDFYYKVKRSRTESDRRGLLVCSRGDQSLKLRTSPRPIFIKKWAAYRNSRNGKGSLEYIFCSAGCRNIEIPFTCLVDERGLIIHRVFHGTMGTFGDCFWQQGKLLERSFKWAERLGLRVMLGHTHPENYGAVCSEIRAPFQEWTTPRRRLPSYPMVYVSLSRSDFQISHNNDAKE